MGTEDQRLARSRVVDNHDLPLAPREHVWDAAAADKRVRAWAAAEEAPNAKYARAFFWHATPAEKFGDFKLPYADVIAGALHAVPRAIFAVAARLNQTDIPDADKAGVKAAMNRYYAKMAKEFADDSIISPFLEADRAQEFRDYVNRRHEFTAEIRADQVDEKTRTVNLAFSSEQPVERFFGTEILDHSPNSVRLARLNGGAALLLNHDSDKQIGVVEHAFIDDDRRGRARVRFSRGPLGSEVFQDVQDGIRRLVSVGYMLHSEPRREPDGALRFMDWEPLELSIVPVPADATVGVGRSAGEQPANTHSRNEECNMDTMEDIATDTPAAEPAPEPANVRQVTEEARRVESERVRSIYAISAKWAERAPDLKDKADEFVNGGRSLAEFQQLVLGRLADVGAIKPATSSGVVLTEKEKRGFSFVRLINHLIDLRGGSSPATCFEIEACQAATDEAKKFGRELRGMLIPESALSGTKREVQVGSGAADLVATDLLAADFIELLRNATPVLGLGPTVLSGLVGNVAIPRQTGGATAYWVAESTDVTESDQSFDQVAFSPKTLGGNTKYSRKTLLQTTPAIEGLVRSDLARVLGVEVDRACINGSGSAAQPKGILATTGVTVIAMGTNGAAPDWTSIVKFRTALSKANALRGNLGWLLNGTTEGTLMTTEKASGYPVYLIGDAGQPLAGSPYALTENVPSNLTKGTGTDLSAMIFGNFSDLLIGEWGGLDIVVDPYSYSKQGGVQITVFRDMDINVRHPASFAVAKDLIA